MFHIINIGIHVAAGTLGLIVGFFAMFSLARGARHKRIGRVFLYLLTIVVATGFVGWLLFRSNAFLLILTVLSGYLGFAGFRNIRLKEKRSSVLDLAASIVALTIG